MSEEKPLTREDVLKLIKDHGGPEGLDLAGRNLAGIDLCSYGGQPQLDLHGIILHNANLQGAKLMVVNLQGADLMVVNLQGADLMAANLQGAKLFMAKLQGANLRGATLSKALLYRAEIGPDTRLENVIWGPKLLLRDKSILGEEEAKDFEKAAEVYRELKQWHTQAGIYDIAGRFYFREMEARRKARSWRGEFGPKFWTSVIGELCGHGEKVEFVVAWGVAIVFGLATAYRYLGEFKEPQSFVNSLYYSVVSFTAVGYGSWAPKPEGWAKAMGAAEAVIGVFMMALFLVTFTRKMTR